ncbi:MAG: response regulator transcription factor [Chloroflexi bacterium]|nr:response regulator transcription factor [Chloroflexota bacterium]
MDNFSADAIRIVILDNHALVRAGLHFIIESQADMQVVGQTGDSNQALSLITSTKPDIILFEHDPENGLSFDIIPDIHRCGNPARLMLVTGSNNRQTYLNAVQSGVLGIVPKTQSPDVLIKAIRKVHAGEVWIEHTLIANLVANSLNGSTPMVVDPAVQSIELLSEREREVIRVIGLGLKNKQIADLLCIGETTVRHHLTSIYSKLGVSDRLELLIFAQRYNLTKIMPDMN